jgi:hypothetical protein
MKQIPGKNKKTKRNEFKVVSKDPVNIEQSRAKEPRRRDLPNVFQHALQLGDVVLSATVILYAPRRVEVVDRPVGGGRV